MREVFGLLADHSPFIREASAVLAAKMLRAESDGKAKVGVWQSTLLLGT